MSFLTDSTSLQLYLASTVSSITSRCILQPVDVTKIRLQLQQYALNELKYKGMFQCMRVIVKEEGFKSLWKGHSSSQILSIVYSNTFYLSYKYTSNLISSIDTNKGVLSHQRPLIAGGIAGVLSMMVAYPFDLVRTRMITQFSNNKVYNTTFDAFKIILKKDGYKGLYRGFLPSVVEIFLYSGIQFAIFEYIENLDLSAAHNVLGSNLTGFIGGGLSGVVPKVLLIPIAIIKKRKQTIDFKNNLLYMGQSQYYNLSVYQWIKSSINRHLFTKRLYAGTLPTIVKTFLFSAFNLSIMKLLLTRHNNSN